MKTVNFNKSATYSRIILLQVLVIISVFLLTGCYVDKKTSPATIDMIVVFSKDVPVEKASSIMFEHEYIFLEGSDSSKGKKYFQETGPKYIVKVPKEKLDVFNTEMKSIKQIYEFYRADYTVNKD